MMSALISTPVNETPTKPTNIGDANMLIADSKKTASTTTTSEVKTAMQGHTGPTFDCSSLFESKRKFQLNSTFLCGIQSKTAIKEPTLPNNIYLNKVNIDEQCNKIIQSNPIYKNETKRAWLLKAITVIDLTTLSGDDTPSNVRRLCHKAANPLLELHPENKLDLAFKKTIKCAAVCVYPSRVQDAQYTVQKMMLSNTIQVASVATAFPSGLCAVESRLDEIQYAISKGATEIDVVIDRSLVLMGKWNVLYNELVKMKEKCTVPMKVILGVGELGSYENIYKASMVAMLAGADFIKTSTGKEVVNATLPVGLVMCRAIRTFYQQTGKKVGLKPAGGLKTARDAINWLVLVYSELGPDWLSSKLFRIGASSLLDNIVKELNKDIQADMS